MSMSMCPRCERASWLRRAAVEWQRRKGKVLFNALQVWRPSRLHGLETARQLITMQLLVTLAVAAAALVHPGSLARRCSPVRHRCVPPVASDRISDNNRAARTQKQQERRTDADRAERSVLEQQQLALKAHRAAIEEFEGSSDWRATLNELHRLRKQ